MSPHYTQFARAKLFSVAYPAITVATLLFGIVWLLNPTSTTHAQSLPEALGTISGVVRNKQGDPLPNLHITLLRDFYSPTIREVTSNAQGEYQFLSVPPGAYKVRYEDKGKSYGTEYYANAILWSKAGTVNVSGNNVTGIDMTLAPGGVISVTVQPSIPITNTNLTLTLFGKTETNRWEVVDTLYWPYTDQELTFYGIPDGVYALCAQLSSPFLYGELSECYENSVLTPSNLPPTDVTEIVISAANHRDIALQFDDFSQLQGTVQSATGQPLANIQVTIANKENYTILAASTDAQGKFHFPRIQDDTYTLQAIDNTRMYMNTFYEEVTTLGQAKPINIDSTSRYSLTLTMQPAGYITGKIRVEGGGIPSNVYFTQFVHIEGDTWGNNNNCGLYPCAALYEPSTGVYTITGLTTGTYRLQAAESYYYYYEGPIATGFYGGHDLQSADDILVTTGKGTPNINITLGINAFNGSIRGSALANDTPKPGIEVGLFRNYPYSQPPYPLVTTKTDAQGNYRFDGLSNGPYQVGFRDPQGDYAMTFYGGGIMTTTTVYITSSTPIDNIDGNLTTLGSTIRGKVKRANGKNPADFTLYIAITNFGANLGFTIIRTDINGNYEIKGLPPGTYRVGAYSPDGGTGPRFYPSAGYGSDESDIVVGENVVIEGIDIPFDIVPSVYLPNVKGNGPTPE